MIRLSAKAANNMVIIAMLVMMALFNLDALRPRSSATLISNLIPDGGRVLKIVQGEYALERVGQQWRWRSPVAVNADPDMMLNAWETTLLETSSLPNGEVASLVEVRVWRAGARDADVFLFSQATDGLYVIHNDSSYRVVDRHLSDLLAWYPQSL